VTARVLVDIGANLAHDSFDADREAVLARGLERVDERRRRGGAMGRGDDGLLGAFFEGGDEPAGMFGGEGDVHGEDLDA